MAKDKILGWIVDMLYPEIYFPSFCLDEVEYILSLFPLYKHFTNTRH